MLAATILAAKYMYDDTFDNTAWATVSSGLFDLDQVNHMERELLGFLDFGLFIQPQDWLQFYENLHLSIQSRKNTTLNMYQIQKEQQGMSQSNLYRIQPSFPNQGWMQQGPQQYSQSVEIDTNIA
jgi:hypothetical protein